MTLLAAAETAANTQQGLLVVVAVCGGLSLLKGPKAALTGWAIALVMFAVMYRGALGTMTAKQNMGAVALLAVVATLITHTVGAKSSSSSSSGGKK